LMINDGTTVHFLVILVLWRSGGGIWQLGVGGHTHWPGFGRCGWFIRARRLSFFEFLASQGRAVEAIRHLG
jgi:hypothetical protein